MIKYKKIFIIIFICILIIFGLVGCNNNSTAEDTKSKVTQELDYLDTQIVSISNNLNNIELQNYTLTSEEVTLGQEETNGSSEGSSGQGGSSQGGGESSGQQKESSSQGGSDTENNKVTTMQMQVNSVLDSNENDIDWTTIKNEIETINEAWGIVILDLSSLNVDNNDILAFSATIDDCILSIKNEDKASALTNIAKLYSYIPKYESGISAQNSTQNIKQVKSYVINAYSLAEQDDWTGMESNMAEAEKTYRNITNDIDYIKDKEYKVNKTYVLMKELQNSLSYKDKKLFYVKYKNLIESINTL